MKHTRIESEVAGRRLVLETGKLAKQADGAIVVTYGETVVLVCAQSDTPRAGIDFFPLTVDYREKTYAAGKFPGGFFKREARPTQKEILTCRVIDRALRPMFPDGYREDLQVMATVLSFDGENDPDIAAMIGAFAAVNVSPIPFSGPMGACRVGYVDGKFVINPTCSQINSGESSLNLTLAATKDAVTMVEAGATGLDEATIIEALEKGHEACAEICALITKLMKDVGKKKKDFDPPVVHDAIDKEVKKNFNKKIAAAVTSKGDKHERKANIDVVRQEAKDFYAKKFAGLDADEAAQKFKYAMKQLGALKDESERATILKGKRTDGRKSDEIRPIWTEVQVLPRTHGSAVFTRGETQALVVATLGTIDDEQIIDGLEDEVRRKFLMHYNFPPFSVGETRPIRGPGRREIGHGALAERAIQPQLPAPEEFPYTIRLVSEILESNGSSSMASVCGGSLALMDAGVPMKRPVAGISIGLVCDENGGHKLLTDIVGEEDHFGVMDFKVAGT
ncbi:MAG: polyribonucleotide nucleotidyltransferase, partial [Planctomycetota bacterium]|nr:polyribonucleotide nucleotidyltransferase [Planctomycetota bacterium]